MPRRFITTAQRDQTRARNKAIAEEEQQRKAALLPTKTALEDAVNDWNTQYSEADGGEWQVVEVGYGKAPRTFELHLRLRLRGEIDFATMFRVRTAIQNIEFTHPFINNNSDWIPATIEVLARTMRNFRPSR